MILVFGFNEVSKIKFVNIISIKETVFNMLWQTSNWPHDKNKPFKILNC